MTEKQKRNNRIRHQLRRMDELMLIDAPDIIILNDILLLGMRITGGAFKFALFALKSWWQTSKMNPAYHYRMWRMTKMVETDEIS